MAQTGFSGIFTSLHIPEDDASHYRKRLTDLGDIAKSYHLDLMVDISGDALTRAGFSFHQTQELIEIGVTGLRMDYHISNQQIAELSQKISIALNASTITEMDIQELRKAGADFDHLEAWHNYYPRPETGLDKNWYHTKISGCVHRGLQFKDLFREIKNLEARYSKVCRRWKNIVGCTR